VRAALFVFGELEPRGTIRSSYALTMADWLLCTCMTKKPLNIVVRLLCFVWEAS
jgi:hypothetical protein